jgi:hypothetical protein
MSRQVLPSLVERGGERLGEVSHEVCEMIGDPAANRWAQTARGALYAIELCDPVELDAYPVRPRNGTHVAVSNFVHPDWLNPYASNDACFDHMGVIDRPFHIAPGGYAMRMRGGIIRNVYAPDYPVWRKKLKRQIGARARARRAYLDV